jgi:hypothetical protein
MSLRDKLGHDLSIGDCIVSVDRENILFIGRIDGLHKTGSLKVTRLTRHGLSGTTYTAKPETVIKFMPTQEFTVFLLKQ